MAPDKVSTHDKILNATKEIIRQQGIEAVTIRQVSRRAQVNCALVNYHFRSKSNLIAIAVGQIVSGLSELFDLLDDDTLPPKERLRQVLQAYVPATQQYQEALKYYFVTNQLFMDPDLLVPINQTVQEQEAKDLPLFNQQTIHKLSKVIAELIGETDPRRLRLAIIQLMCAAIIPNIITSKLKDHTLPDTATQVDLLLNYMF